MKTYKGSCHCQAVTFEVEMEPESGMECNCSHCSIKGLLLTFVPGTNFRLVSGEDNLTEYLFNKKHITHPFCKLCGAQAFGKGKDGEGNEMIAVNLRCVADLDIETLPRKKFNGKDL